MLGISLGVSPGNSGVPGFEWFASSLALPPGFTFTRSGTRPYLSSTGAWASAATDTPRFDFQPGRAGLLVAGARTNKVTAAKSNPSATTNCTTSGDAAGVLSVIDGTTPLGAAYALFGPNIYRIDNSAGAAPFYVRFGGTTGGTSAHSLSCIAYGAGDMLLYDGTTETGAVAIDGASFARFTANNVTPANSSQQFCIKCAAGETAYVVVPQLEQAVFADPTPIPGSTGAVTVNAETCSRSVTLPSGGFTQVMEFIASADTSAVYWQVDDGSSNNRFRLYGLAGGLLQGVTAGGVDQGGSTVGAITPGTRYRVAARYSANDCRAAANGALGALDTTVTMPTGVVTERWGTNHAPTAWIYSHILASNASPTVWRPPVTDAELQALSTLT